MAVMAVVALLVALRMSLMVTVAYLVLARLPTKACSTSKPCAQVAQPRQLACAAVAAAMVAAAAVLVVLDGPVAAVIVVALWSAGLVQQQRELRLCLHVQMVTRPAACSCHRGSPVARRDSCGAKYESPSSVGARP